MSGTTVELARTVTGLRNVFHDDADRVVRRGVRIAGARHVVQGALTLAVPELRILGALTDALHAASMLGVALASRRFRRAALAQAGLAATFAVAELLTLSETAPPTRSFAPINGSRGSSPARR